MIVIHCYRCHKCHMYYPIDLFPIPDEPLCMFCIDKMANDRLDAKRDYPDKWR